MLEIEDDLYYLHVYSENKGVDQLCGYRADDLRLCFRICKTNISHDAAHISHYLKKPLSSKCYERPLQHSIIFPLSALADHACKYIFNL